VNQRFYSLDVFRGATVALMILVNTPGSWDFVYAPLDHAPWHGCTPTDLVFPFFLFAVGNAMAFVMPKLQQAGDGVFWKKVLKRTALIFGIGFLLNWFPFVMWHGEHLIPKGWTWLNDAGTATNGIRVLGVLQRIALCYFFASVLVYYLKARGAFVAGVTILFAYWLICFAFGGDTDPYSLKEFFGIGFDKAILSEAHMYKGEGIPFDPEGFASTPAAIVQVIFGYLVGDYILQKGKTFEMVSSLFVIGCVFVFAGFCWDMVFPINKKIWSSSYTVYTTGLAIMVLALLMHIIEFWKWQGGWSKFFDVFGKNPLFIFVLSGVIGRIYGLFHFASVNEEGKAVTWNFGALLFHKVFAPIFGNMNGSLLYAIFHIIIFWFICYVLDKKKIYIKV
jgi:predicted acyltransferase